mgnify:CR=1 FL=1
MPQVALSKTHYAVYDIMGYNQGYKSCMEGIGMSKNMDPNGSTWAELQKQLYTQTEIEESRRRVAAVEPQAAAGDTVASATRKNS